MSSPLQESTSSVMRNLDAISKSIPNGMAARVGILGDNATRQEGDGTSNAEIGVIQEFGSVSKNIPPRSFLRMPLEQNVGAIAKFMSQPKMVDMILSGNAVRAFGLMGAYAEMFIQKAFASRGFGQWKPNSPVTIAAKGSDAPLIDTRQLSRSITSEVVGG